MAQARHRYLSRCWSVGDHGLFGQESGEVAVASICNTVIDPPSVRGRFDRTVSAILQGDVATVASGQRPNPRQEDVCDD